MERKTIELTRNDLKKISIFKSIEELTINDFKFDTTAVIYEAYKITFTDLNNEVKVFKDRGPSVPRLFSVTIDGFISPEEAEEFCHWYSGSGEQDSCEWFEAAIDAGREVRSFVGCQSIFSNPETGNVMMSVAPREN